MSESALAEVVRTFVTDAGLEWEMGARSNEFVVVLPGEKKLKTVVSLVVSASALSMSAFVIRNPDENHHQVYRFLLRRNLRMPGLRCISTSASLVTSSTFGQATLSSAATRYSSDRRRSSGPLIPRLET